MVDEQKTPRFDSRLNSLSRAYRKAGPNQRCCCSLAPTEVWEHSLSLSDSVVRCSSGLVYRLSTLRNRDPNRHRWAGFPTTRQTELLRMCPHANRSVIG